MKYAHADFKAKDTLPVDHVHDHPMTLAINTTQSQTVLPGKYGAIVVQRKVLGKLDTPVG